MNIIIHNGLIFEKNGVIMKINFKKIITDISADELTIYAAQASYYITVSAFPFIMMMISLTGFLIPRETVYSAISGVVPQIIKPVVLKLADELLKKSIPIISFGAITALWSASRGFAAVERGICRVYQTAKKRNFVVSSVYSVIYTFLFMGVLVLTLIFQVFGNFLIDFFYIYQYGMFIKWVLFLVIVSVFFCLIYYIFSGRKQNFFMHMAGAGVSALGWIIFSKLYSVYINNFSNYSYIYGSLTAVVLILLWIYVCVIILLFGAEINKLMMKRSDYFG